MFIHKIPQLKIVICHWNEKKNDTLKLLIKIRSFYKKKVWYALVYTDKHPFISEKSRIWAES